LKRRINTPSFCHSRQNIIFSILLSHLLLFSFFFSSLSPSFSLLFLSSRISSHSQLSLLSLSLSCFSSSCLSCFVFHSIVTFNICLHLIDHLFQAKREEKDPLAFFFFFFFFYFFASQNVVNLLVAFSIELVRKRVSCCLGVLTVILFVSCGVTEISAPGFVPTPIKESPF